MAYRDLYGVMVDPGVTGTGRNTGSTASAANNITSVFKATPDTAGLQRAASYAEQDRAQGIANYNDDRNRFYAGQEAANQAKLGAYNTNVGWITQDRARYAQVFQPLEDRLAALATPTAAAYDQAAGRASADVAQSFASQRGQMAREAARLGVSPTSGRYADMMASGGLSETAALTGALSTARKSVDDRADTALKAGLDVGQRYRQTQQVTAPELDYKVMGPREANGIESQMAQIASQQAELSFQADQAAIDKAFKYWGGLPRQ